MKLRSGVSLWTLLVFTALLKNARAECHLEENCTAESLTTLRKTVTTETTVTLPNCSLSTGNLSGNGSITHLTPGAVYQINFHCRNCCKEVTMKPEKVNNLDVTDITTSSIFLNWTKPNGNSSFYRVNWTDGTKTNDTNVTETYINITDLTAGVWYTVNVTAVGDDHVTEGASVSVSNYTKPERVDNLKITGFTTSSISLDWTKPNGNSSFYRVQYTDGTETNNTSVTQTYINITDLTAGAQYTVTVTAVAHDGLTEGTSVSVSQYTKPEVVRNLTITDFTTSSISLNWTKPEGNSSFYRVKWTDGTVTKSANETGTYMTITNLTAGVQYNMSVTAVADDHVTEGASADVFQYTKPEVVRNLTVSDFTTSSISLNWTKPEGNSSFYRVQWTGGDIHDSVNVNETFVVITGLTAGVQYTISVTAVALDRLTEGQSDAVSQYTKPGEIENVNVSSSTTSISLSWTPPPGQVSDYKVEWDNSGTPMTRFTSNETSALLSDLIPGTNYMITITAVAGPNKTKGDGRTLSSFTKPEVVRNLTVTNYTTSWIFVNWTEPEGNSSFYRVQWKDGNVSESDNVTEAHKNITNLTPGVRYNITVTAVAGDNHTEGQNSAVSHYTKPGTIENINVSSSTTSISLSWTPPPGQVSDYKVEWNDGETPLTRFTSNETSAVLSGLIPGTNYMITITTVAGDNQTEGEPFTFTYITEPAVVKDLTITKVTTTSVSLNWTKPEGNADQYRILWTTGENPFRNTTTTETSFTIRDLFPGFQYNITVTAVVGQTPKEGGETLNTTFTRPDKPENISAVPGTDDLIISWTLPRGRVDDYVVNVSHEDPSYSYSNSTRTADTTANFADLYPGRIFAIVVTAVAGDFHNSSDSSSFATVPTPPGSIIFSQRNVSSLHVEWTTPVGMEGAPNISYHITYQDDGREIGTDSTDNNTELSSLSSGTFYNVTVQTVGPQNLTSTIVHNSTFTLPHPVQQLEARPKNTTSITVEWTHPQEYKSYYNYSVQTYYETGAQVESKNISNNFTDVTGLEPGSKYNISVTTIAAPGSESTVKWTSSYTMPKAVTNLTADPVNTTAIRLTWIGQSNPNLSYLVEVLQDDVVLGNDSTVDETYTFYSLEPGNLYIFYVYTVVAGVKSARETTQSYTMPEPVHNLTAIGSTTNLTVSWIAGSGKVSSYSVLLCKDSQLVKNATDLSNTTTNKTFMDLSPGVLYLVKVFTKSGNLENPANVSNATFPNPPGPIIVESQTVRSINFTWPLPVDMNHSQCRFNVSSANGHNQTQNTWFLLDNLTSGSPHNISVVTVGVWNYESTAVTAENYTRPYSVTNLTETEITTDAVTLVWEQPEVRSDYTYLVQVSNGSFDIISKNESVTNTTVSELLSGSNFSFTVTTRTADGTKADPVTVSYFTRPFSISGLVAETLNTTAINLTWMKPLEYKDDYKYLIKTTGCPSKNTTHAEEMVVISGLQSGTKCTFCISVMAANGIEGKENCTSQYTRPEPRLPSISSNGSNSSVVVSWTKPPKGNIEFYKVYLNSTSGFLDGPVELNANDTFYQFENLSAGTLYSAILITCSGPFNASSEYVTNATFPNPPGPIEIQEKMTSSIKFNWGEAPQMSGRSFHYQVTIKPSQGGGNITTTATNHTFASLPSGTSFNISVVTVGVWGFVSRRVYRNMVTTRPLSVRNLTETPGEVSVAVNWTRPDEYKESYRYNVTWQRSDGANNASTKIQSQTEVTINNLDPGSSYNISVTTKTSDGTLGAPITTSTCTKASPVKDLTCTGPNTTNAKVILHWTKPNGRYSGFTIRVNNGEIVHTTGTCCDHAVSNLLHNTVYKLTVETQSCGEPSNRETVSCKTGITNPPRPNSCQSLDVKEEHDRFSFKIEHSMLNSSNGPITYIAVLVTSDAPENDDLKEYLGKTYTEWKEKKTPVYLATATNSIAKPQSKEDRIVVGNGSKWKGYTNGALNSNREYQYAIAIFTGLELQQQEGLVDINSSLVSITGFCPVVKLPIDPAVIGIAVGATLGIFCVLFLVLIGFIVYWKRISKKETSDIQIQSMRAKVSVQVRVEEYEDYYRKQKADSNCGFAEEFEDLKVVGTSQAKIHALTLDNKPKNRYNNVLPYDSSRVKLSIIHGSPHDDYINASYMPGYLSRKEFIAAQGPLPTTVNEFWRMIWEKNVQTLVMLTRCNEQGRVKCEQYWGSGTKHFENITVKTTSEIPLEDWTIRDFDIKNVKTAETRSIRHFHFTAWPDHGVPETTELLISFRHLVREHMNQYSRHSPTVVHCSAGVGRTGTFISIDRLIFQIERENIVDVFGIVYDLRMHRPLMVQTEDQYVFLNQCALDVIRSRTGTNVDLIYQNTAALSIYENVEPKKRYSKNGYHNA